MRYLVIHTYNVLVLVVLNINAADYCNMCKKLSHTLCKYKEGPSLFCKDYKKIDLLSSSYLQEIIVDFHNELRNKVALGLEKNGKPGPQPPAANMLLMKWDNELAVIAQRWADQCISSKSNYQHDECKTVERFSVGQNVITVIQDGFRELDFTFLIQNWYNQVKEFSSSRVDKYKLGFGVNRELSGHYSQIIWAHSEYVGCAHSSFSEGFLIDNHNMTKTITIHRFICNYGPAGNIMEIPVYNKGEPCSNCLECDSKYKGLCIGFLYEKETYERSQMRNWFDKYQSKRLRKRDYVGDEVNNKNIDSRKTISYTKLDTEINNDYGKIQNPENNKNEKIMLVKIGPKINTFFDVENNLIPAELHYFGNNITNVYSRSEAQVDQEINKEFLEILKKFNLTSDQIEKKKNQFISFYSSTDTTIKQNNIEKILNVESTEDESSVTSITGETEKNITPTSVTSLNRITFLVKNDKISKQFINKPNKSKKNGTNRLKFKDPSEAIITSHQWFDKNFMKVVRRQYLLRRGDDCYCIQNEYSASASFHAMNVLFVIISCLLFVM